MSSSETARLPYQPALDGLRGVAVIAVLLFHSEFTWAQGGFLGVSAFFTLSGYLIASLLLAEYDTTAQVRLGSFYARRVRRLVPAALLGLLLASLYIYAVGTPPQGEAFRTDGLFALFNVANWRFVAADSSYAHLFLDEIAGLQSPVLHYWSLAIEEQFYLVFPVAFALLLRFTRGSLMRVGAVVATLAVASFSIGFLGTVVNVVDGAPLDRYYFGTDARVVELLVGVLLALVLARRTSPMWWRRWSRLVGPAALVVVLGTWTKIDVGQRGLFRGGLLIHALVIAVLIAAAREAGPARDALSLRPLRALGRISYGVYIFHWPLFLWIDERHTSLSGPALFAVRMAATLGLAIASYVLVEQPVRSGRLPTPRWRVAAPVGSIAVVVIAVLALPATLPEPSTVYASVGSADRPPPLATSSSSSRSAVTGGETSTTSGSGMPSEAPGPGRPLRVLVIGDSVGQTMGRGLERWGPSHDVAVWNRARFFCGLVTGGVMKVGLVEQSSSAACNAGLDLMRESIDVFDPDLTVILSTFWDSVPRRLDGWGDFRTIGDPMFDAHMRAEYGAAADELTRKRGAVLWMKAPCNDGEAIGGYAAQNAAVDDVATARRPLVQSYPLDELLCDPPPELADARRDDGTHFTDPGADVLAAVVGDEIIAAATAAAAARGG